MIFFDVVVEGIFDAFILVVQSRSVLKIFLSLDGAVVPSPVAVTCYTIAALINNFVLIITDRRPRSQPLNVPIASGYFSSKK